MEERSRTALRDASGREHALTFYSPVFTYGVDRRSMRSSAASLALSEYREKWFRGRTDKLTGAHRYKIPFHVYGLDAHKLKYM